MTAPTGTLDWHARYGGIETRGYIYDYVVTKQGRFWAAAMKYSIIRGDDHWNLFRVHSP